MRLLNLWIRFSEAIWPLVAVAIVCLAAYAIARTWRHDRGLAVRAERDVCAEIAAALSIPPEYSEEQRSIARYMQTRIARAIRARGLHLSTRAEE